MTQSICAHLEKHLPQPLDGDFPQVLAHESISRHTQDVFKFYHPTQSISVDEFKAQMRSFGILDSWDMELLEARYYHNMSARRIASEHDYVSHDTVSRRLKKLHSLLEERGYKRKKPQ